MCRCRDALRRLAIRKIDRREHPSRVRKPFHTQESQCLRNGERKAPRPANPCSKILCKSCRRFTTSRAPNKKTVYTPGPDPSGSTHRRLHKYCAHFRGSPPVPRGPRPARAQEQVDRAAPAGRQGASYLLCGGRCGRVQCAIARLSTCPNACLPPRASAMFACVCCFVRVFAVCVVVYTNQTPRIDPAYKLRHGP